jgi:hypothetical protein
VNIGKKACVCRPRHFSILIKYDGYRTLIAIDRGQVRAFTRNGNDWTKAYKWRVGACRFRDIASAIQMPGRIGEKFAAMAIERLNRRHYF